MLGARLDIARPGYDTRTAADTDIAMSSRFPMLKFFRLRRSDSAQSLAHGLDYRPTVFFMREVSSSPLQIGHSTTSDFTTDESSIDATNINFEISTHFDAWTGTSVAPVDDEATIAFMAIDPLVTPTSTSTEIAKDIAVLKVKDDNDTYDFQNKINTKYDTLKVFNSGTITLNLAQWTANASSDVDTQTATYTHNLGYVPFFAPFVPAEISITDFYGWDAQWHNRHAWSTGNDYLPRDNVSNGAGLYVCKVRHTSTSADEPGVGANWTTYWDVLTADLIPTTLDLNSLEDIKYVFGGYFSPDKEIARIYATTTQLVVKYERYSYIDPLFNPGPIVFPARTVTLGYTVFYNKINEEFNLLTD